MENERHYACHAYGLISLLALYEYDRVEFMRSASCGIGEIEDKLRELLAKLQHNPDVQRAYTEYDMAKRESNIFIAERRFKQIHQRALMESQILALQIQSK